MIINNFIEFMSLASKLQFCNIDSLSSYYGGYANICACKPTLKNLYYEKTEKKYVEYVNSNTEHIKEKIKSSDMNDPIVIFKNKNGVFCTLEGY